MLRTGRFSKRRGRGRTNLTRMYRGAVVFAAMVLLAIGAWGVIR